MKLNKAGQHGLYNREKDKNTNPIQATIEEIAYVKDQIYRVLEQGNRLEEVYGEIDSTVIQFIIVFAKSRTSQIEFLSNNKPDWILSVKSKTKPAIYQQMIKNFIQSGKERIYRDAKFMFHQMSQDSELLDEDVGSSMAKILSDKKMLEEYSRFVFNEMIFFQKPHLNSLSKDEIITFNLKKYDFAERYNHKKEFCKNFIFCCMYNTRDTLLKEEKQKMLEMFASNKKVVHSVFSTQGKRNLIEQMSFEIAEIMIIHTLFSDRSMDSMSSNKSEDVIIENGLILSMAPYIFTMFMHINTMLREDALMSNEIIKIHLYDYIQAQIALQQQKKQSIQLKSQPQRKTMQKSFSFVDTNTASEVKVNYPEDFNNVINDYTHNHLLIRVLRNYYKKNKKISINELLELCKKEIEEGRKEYYDFIALEQCFRKYNLIEECVQGEQITNQFIESKTQNTSQSEYTKTQKKYENIVTDVLSKKRKCDEISGDMIVSMLEEVGYTIYNQETFAKQLIGVMQSHYKETIINRLCLHYLYSDMYRREKHEFQKQQGVKSFRLKLGNNTGFRIFFLDNEVHMIGTHDEYEKYIKNL